MDSQFPRLRAFIDRATGLMKPWLEGWSHQRIIGLLLFLALGLLLVTAWGFSDPQGAAPASSAGPAYVPMNLLLEGHFDAGQTDATTTVIRVPRDKWLVIDTIEGDAHFAKGQVVDHVVVNAWGTGDAKGAGGFRTHPSFSRLSPSYWKIQESRRLIVGPGQSVMAVVSRGAAGGESLKATEGDTKICLYGYFTDTMPTPESVGWNVN